MTSEVIAMNRMGVALAADSVVSIYSAGVHKKKHDCGTKLFSLSDKHPVGVMVYNNTSLLGVPWETIVKLFRNFLGETSFSKLEDYGYALIEFLTEHDTMFPINVQRQYFLDMVQAEYGSLRIESEQRLIQLRAEQYMDEETASSSQRSIFDEVLQKHLERKRNLERATGLDNNSAIRFLEPISDELVELMNQVFGEWPLTEPQVEQLKELASLLIHKKNWHKNVETGLVLGGFGEQEHFPVMQQIEVSGMYDNTPKWEEIEVQRIDENQHSYIQPFAVTKTVDQFITGMDSGCGLKLEEATQTIRQFSTEVIDILAQSNESQLVEANRRAFTYVRNIAEELHESVEYLVQRRKTEVLRTIGVLHLQDLANVATMLVKLSSFDQQLSFQTETVGEPIDVAVISKGDGFIWIDRKYYFNAELNYRYFDRVRSDTTRELR